MLGFLCQVLNIKDIPAHQKAPPSRLHWSGKEGLSPERETQRERSSTLGVAPRDLLIHSPVRLGSGWRRQDRHLFLFSDLLLVSNAQYERSFQIKYKIPLNALWLADGVDAVGEGHGPAQRSLLLGWPTASFLVTFPSLEQKEQWRASLQKSISLAKEKDDPKSIPLNILTEDMPNGVCPVTITVTNTDTVTDVINKSLGKLGVSGLARDYQLCLGLGKRKALGPLTGHEHPYAIKMSHLLSEGQRKSVSPLSTQWPLLEQLSPEVQCRFVLKPRLPAKGQRQDSSGRKTAKTRGSLLSGFFGRYGHTSQHHRDTTPPAPKAGQLFGTALTDICDKDDLPAPLLGMLSCINQKGPLSEGIFRKSANIHSCRALKDKLNSGDKVDLDSESVFVVASVLKDFLRNLPDSLLLSDLYDGWLGVLEGGREEDKVNAVQGLLGQLPKANVVLLRHLLGALHNIQQHCSSNQMTAYNLSVCIAPSILWPSASCRSPLGNEFTKRISLVQFLIENCLSIFGEEVSSLLAEDSRNEDSEALAGQTQEPLESKPVGGEVLSPKGQVGAEVKATPGTPGAPWLGSAAFQEKEGVC